MIAREIFPSATSLAVRLTARQLLAGSLSGQGWSLFQHQLDFLRIQLHSPVSLLLAGDPGTGKTLVAIRSIAFTVQALRNAGAWLPCLYVLPANLSRQVEREFRRFDPQLRLAVLRTGQDRIPSAWDYDVLLVSYTLPVTSRRTAEAIADLNSFALVVFDESHMLRSVTARRTRYWANLARRARWVLPMSGTPFVNSGEDLFTNFHMLGLLDEPGIGVPGPDGRLRPATFAQFCQRFVAYREMTINGRSFTKAVGTKNIEILNQVLAPRLVRWVAAELLSLPPLITERHYLDTEDVRDQLAAPAQEQVAELLARRCAGEEITEEQLAKAVDETLGSEALSTYRRLIGTAKAPLVAEWIIDRIAGGGVQTLIFGHHRAVLESIKKKLDEAKIPAGLIYGGTSVSKRDQQVQAFQAAALKVLVLQIETAGLGLNLQAANHVVFAELPWTSAAYQQAIARAHRAGQQQHVLVSIATLPDSLDEIIASTIARKAAEAAAVLDTTPNLEDAI